MTLHQDDCIKLRSGEGPFQVIGIDEDHAMTGVGSANVPWTTMVAVSLKLLLNRSPAL
jgi:hypothetical protein